MVDTVDATPPTEQDTVVDDDAPGPPISVPDSGDAGEGGRLKMIIQLVKKSLGVKDIAAMWVPSHPLGPASHHQLPGVCLCPRLCSSRCQTWSIGITLIDPICLLRMSIQCSFQRVHLDFLTRINDSDDAFERMLAVVRFTFTKDLKFIVRCLLFLRIHI